jgi:hypothetical protein
MTYHSGKDVLLNANVFGHRANGSANTVKILVVSGDALFQRVKPLPECVTELAKLGMPRLGE